MGMTGHHLNFTIGAQEQKECKDGQRACGKEGSEETFQTIHADTTTREKGQHNSGLKQTQQI